MIFYSEMHSMLDVLKSIPTTVVVHLNACSLSWVSGCHLDYYFYQITFADFTMYVGFMFCCLSDTTDFVFKF